MYGHLVFRRTRCPWIVHRAPAMTRDSIVFGVYVGGVCAVGCDRPKVLAAMEAVKATEDVAGLQCSENEG